MRHHQTERIKTEVRNGERENLEPVTTRLPFSVAAQLDGLADETCRGPQRHQTRLAGRISPGLDRTGRERTD